MLVLTIANKPKNSPFDLPPLVMTPVSRKELLEVLRSRINKGYMPTATGSVQYNTKPQYLRHALTEVEGTWPKVTELNYSGYYAFETFDFVYRHDCIIDAPKHIYLFLKVKNIFVLLNLTTEEMLVSHEHEVYHPWTEDEQTVPMDRIELWQAYEMYL